MPRSGAGRVSNGRRVLLALWRKDAIRLTRHPVVAVGALYSLVLSLNVPYGSPALDDYQSFSMLSALIMGPPTLFAANLVASRDRRAGSIEMLSSTPAGARTRTSAMLFANLGPAALSIVVIAVALGAFRLLDMAPPRWPPLGELAVQPATVLGAGLLGVMTARWLPIPGGAAIVMVALVLWVDLSGYHLPSETAMSLAPIREFEVSNGQGHVTGTFAGSLPWHIAYILCLDAMAAIGALLATPGPKKKLLTAGAVAVTGAIITGWIQLP
jgi:hypothetical protein